MQVGTMLLAFAVGAGLVLQVGMNVALGRALGSPVLGSLVNFLVGSMAIAAFVLLRVDLPGRAQFAAAPLSTRALIIDAPLLFEVGLERECDAVLFVDTPRDLRLARVRASRGWDDAELARREASQIPLEEKRRRSSDLVANTGDPAALEAAVAAALDAIIARTAPT